MISFKISAPGKIILFGEHAVVYGKTAVAASLNRRTSIIFKQLCPEDQSITIKLPKLGISRNVSVDKVSQVLFGAELPRLSTDGHDKFYQRIREFVETMGLDEPRQKTSYECLFYALVQVAQQVGLNLQAFEMEIDTELSIGAGLGSSASFSVCLVATFLHWSRLQKSAAALSQFDHSSLETISQYALNCEKIMHGSPSGIDNSICTFGSVVEFRKGEAPHFIPLEARSLRVMLVDTKVGRSTKLLVEKVAGLMSKYPKIFPGIMDAIDDISKRAIDIIKEMQTLNDNDNEQLLQAHQELSTLIEINQGLLDTCQVSHTSLDLIRLTSKKYGFACKLTGAGGGGFAYILIPPDSCSNKVKDLSLDLTQNGYSVIETNLGGSGVEIHGKL